jgi:hypothetical protein
LQRAWVVAGDLMGQRPGRREKLLQAPQVGAAQIQGSCLRPPCVWLVSTRFTLRPIGAKLLEK